MIDRGTRATPENRGAGAAARYRGERSSRTDGGKGRRARHVLEVEDVLLAGWVFASEALVRRWIGEPGELLLGLTMEVQGDGWIDWLRALPAVGWVVLGLFFFILLTRGPEDTDRDVALERRWPMLALALPVLSAYSLVATGIQKLAFGIKDWPASGKPPWPGPYVPGIVRRTAAVPLALLGDTLFRQEIALAGLDIGATGGPPALSPLLALQIAGSVFPFAIFVAGPRIAAGDVLAWRPWILRFLLFYASVFLSFVW